MHATRLAAIALCCGAWLATGVQAQGTYPGKPVRFLVGFTPGGLTDVFARALAQNLGQRLGQPVLVENRPGASQMIALDALAKAAPDGYTVGYGTQSGMVFTTAMKKTLPYDPLRDFAPISLLFSSPMYLIVHPAVPAANVRELVAHVKANPGKLSFASVGVGSAQHIAMELFRSRTDLDMVHVPYKGSAPASTDMMAGRVQVMFEGTILNEGNIRAGKLRALASTGAQRMRSQPQLPTVSESGVPGFEIATWFGLQTSAGVPRPVIDRLNREVAEFLRLPETRENLADKFSLDLMGSTPEAMAERIGRQIPEFTRLLRSRGIDPE